MGPAELLLFDLSGVALLYCRNAIVKAPVEQKNIRAV